MRVVITGVAGFIGSNLAKRLLNEGNEVVGIDSLTKDNPTEVKEFRLRELQVFTKFEFVKLDINNAGILSLMADKKCDYFFHLSSKDIYYHIPEAFPYYSDFFEVNALGTIKMYELANKMKAKKFITTSTFSVYGNTKKQILTEKKILPNPISPHGASKVAMESSLKYLNHHLKLPCIVFRVFSVYGPNMPTHTAIYNIVASAVNNTELQFHANFSHQTRDFVYIDDVVEYLCLGMKKRLGFQVVNLASGKSTSLAEFVDTVNKLSARSIEKVSHADRKDLHQVLVTHVIADTKRAEKLFNYKAKTNLSDGLSKTLKWYEQNKGMAKFSHYREQST